MKCGLIFLLAMPMVFGDLQEDRKKAVKEYRAKYEELFNKSDTTTSVRDLFTPDCKVQSGGNYTLKCEGGDYEAFIAWVRRDICDGASFTTQEVDPSTSPCGDTFWETGKYNFYKAGKLIDVGKYLWVYKQVGKALKGHRVGFTSDGSFQAAVTQRKKASDLHNAKFEEYWNNSDSASFARKLFTPDCQIQPGENSTKKCEGGEFEAFQAWINRAVADKISVKSLEVDDSNNDCDTFWERGEYKIYKSGKLIESGKYMRIFKTINGVLLCHRGTFSSDSLGTLSSGAGALAKGTPVEKNPCAIELDRVQAQNAPPGKFIPTCTDNGWYHYRQCHGSTGQCWCAFPQTGKELTNTRTAPGSNQLLVCPKCLVDQSEALPPVAFVGAYVPQCNEQGNFKPIQAHVSTGHRWCVNEITGAEINGTRVTPGSANRLSCEN